jgi:energy-coupling factor transporter ATP-binding protein EcfA2
MKLTKIKVENFKRVERAEFDLAGLNILVGSNGSGKSSIIQAIHLGCCVIRQVDGVGASSSTVGTDRLDYLPTDSYPSLGHKSTWGNNAGSNCSKLEMTFQQDAEPPVTASCELRSARNAGISIRGSIPNSLSDKLRNKRKFFSAYIPGISGIPNKEEKRSEKVILKACSYGDSNIFLRNALHLLSERDKNKPNGAKKDITQIEDWTAEIGDRISIDVRHTDAQDLVIRCDVRVGGTGASRPIELLGTGYLQLIQIFCYILLFDPGVLLIDEPDIHLHPSVQERLVKVLARVADERQFKILMTTHSPFVVRGAPADANVCWVNDGKIEVANRSQVELALGWGAFGKKVILISEDQHTDFLKWIIAQWPGIDRAVTFLPGRGFKSVTTPDQAAEMSEALGGRYKILIHRDRDSLTDQEVAHIQARYEAKGVFIWFPELSDVEGYFCKPAFIQSLLGCLEPEATQYIENILTGQAFSISEQFAAQRAAHNQELHAAGGSPVNADVWAAFQGRPLRGAKGKFVFRQLKNIPGNAFREESILKHKPNVELAIDLKLLLEQIVA